VDAPAPSPREPGDAHEIGNRTYLVADVQPLDVTGVRTVAVGTVLFLVAGLALLPFYGWLEETDREWWVWTCAAGFGLGLFGFDYCRRRARHHDEGHGHQPDHPLG
jgi:hypothetical protein